MVYEKDVFHLPCFFYSLLTDPVDMYSLSLSLSPSLSFFFYFLVLWHLRLWQSMAGKTDKVMGKLYLYWCCMITLFIVNVL